MFVQKRLATTTAMNITKPSKNIGLLPTISADRGNMKDPTKHPAIKDEPKEPIWTWESQYKFICSTQL